MSKFNGAVLVIFYALAWFTLYSCTAKAVEVQLLSRISPVEAVYCIDGYVKKSGELDKPSKLKCEDYRK